MRKFSIFNFQFSIEIFFLIFVLYTLYLIPYTFQPTYAQSLCGSSGASRATGLVSTPTLTGKFTTSSEGKCIVDTKSTFAPYRVPTFEDLKSLYFTQAKNISGVVKKVDIDGSINSQVLTDHLNSSYVAFPISDLVSYWKMDETGGADVSDSVASNNGISNSSSNITITGQKLGTAARTFDGLSQRISVSDNVSLRPAQISVSAWVKPTVFSNWATVAMKSSTSSWTDGWGLVHYRDTEEGVNNINFFINNYSSGKASGTVPLNQWSHLVGTYDGSSVKLYINGTLAQSTPLTAAISNSTNSLTIGIGSGSDGSQYLWNGMIDEAGMWSRALATTEVTSLFNGGNGLAYSTSPPESTPNLLINVNGDLNIDSSLQGTRTGVIFVNGTMNITSNITYPSANLGLVFIVSGDVNIASSVTQIDAVIISGSYIYTAGSGCSLATNPGTNSQLVINGSLVSLDEAKPIRFCRTLDPLAPVNNTNSPAEKINHEVKYLVLLRDILSDTLQRWSEIP